MKMNARIRYERMITDEKEKLAKLKNLQNIFSNIGGGISLNKTLQSNVIGDSDKVEKNVLSIIKEESAADPVKANSNTNLLEN